MIMLKFHCRVNCGWKYSFRIWGWAGCIATWATPPSLRIAVGKKIQTLAKICLNRFHEKNDFLRCTKTKFHFTFNCHHSSVHIFVLWGCPTLGPTKMFSEGFKKMGEKWSSMLNFKSLNFRQKNENKSQFL